MDLRRLAEDITGRRLAKAGAAVAGDVREQMITDCEERLDNVVNREILLKLEELGKVAEFERVLNGDGDPLAFLVRVIPNYPNWAEQTTRRAVKEIEGGR